MIICTAISAGYGTKTVLNSLDFHARPGEFIGLVGPNGSGKTTLLNCMNGILAIRSGQIAINGKNLDSLSTKERAKSMATVPQFVDVSFGLQVFNLVLMGRYPYLPLLGGYSDHDHATARSAMRQAGVHGFGDRRADTLSGGERQRVFLARALAQETPVLLLDEPASALDMGAKTAAFDLLARKHRIGTTIVCALHDLNLAAMYCSRLVLLVEGKILRDGRAPDILTPEIIKEAYGTDVAVSPHPVTGDPQVFLVPGDGPVLDD